MTALGAAGASPDPVSKLIDLLAEERKNFTSIEIAETLWLAMQMEPAAEFVADEPQHPPPTPPHPINGGSKPKSPPPPLPPPIPINITAPTSPAGVLPPQTLPVWLADPAMLTDSLAIVRALKPLFQKVAAGIGKRLDEPATVDNIVRTRLCLPILQPEQEPWFDIILVVDRGSSMHIWQRLVKDIVRILRHYGAFRDVRVFDLVVNPAGRSTNDVVQLISKPQGFGHRASELIDQRGRRIAILLSDCAGAYWWDGTLLPMLQEWGKVMPTVVWQMLPAWMWKRTALGRGTAVAIGNDIPGAANQRLKVRVQERDEPDDADRRLSVPVVTSEVRELARWSLMVAGDRREVTPGFLFPPQGGSVPRSKGIEEVARDRARQTLDEGSSADPDAAFNQALETIARDRVQRFRELASLQAQRLIALLAAAPVITLPVVRLIRDAMLYDVQSPLPIAEVFSSGLLQRLPGQEKSYLERVLQEERDSLWDGKAERLQTGLERQDPDQMEESDLNELEQMQSDWQDLVQYDFPPKVRNILWEVLPAVDTIEVINSVSAAVERRWNQFSNEDFRAFLTNPNVEVPERLTGLRSFASVTADILEPLGGEYARFARQLRDGGSPPTPPIKTDDFPLRDLEYEVAKLVNLPPQQTCEYESATITAILDRFDFETATLEKKKKKRSSKGRGGWEISRRAASTWGYTEVLSRETGEDFRLDMIAIPGGSFRMGAPKSEPESWDNERPQHDVTLQTFYLGRYAVTQAQWRVVAGYESVDKELDPNPSRFKGDNRPVENVSWDDAQEFCQRLSAKMGKDYRLPSEAQWEYACRAGKTTPFHFGETIAPALANYDGTKTYKDSPKGEWRQTTTDVGSFPANDWGLHDMHGNVLEWCEDDYHDNYTDAPSDGRAWVESDRTKTLRVLRGGSWVVIPENCRSAVRGNYTRGGIFYDVGFRVCCVPPSTLYRQNWLVGISREYTKSPDPFR